MVSNAFREAQKKFGEIRNSFGSAASAASVQSHSPSPTAMMSVEVVKHEEKSSPPPAVSAPMTSELRASSFSATKLSSPKAHDETFV